MRPQPSSHVRIARPSRDLDQAGRFWIDGLGLEVLYRAGTDAEGGHALLMLGWPEAAWHLELVEDPNAESPASSTDEDLLVLYVGGPIDEEAVNQLVRAGGQQVAARNPYWDRWGVTVLDPDGYRLVLTAAGRPGVPRGDRAGPTRSQTLVGPHRRSGLHRLRRPPRDRQPVAPVATEGFTRPGAAGC
jgi:catechol 2,3-dioxygenase-like lactoylglutathione lyase family enzyme